MLHYNIVVCIALHMTLFYTSSAIGGAIWILTVFITDGLSLLIRIVELRSNNSDSVQLERRVDTVVVCPNWVVDPSVDMVVVCPNWKVDPPSV